MKRPTEEQFNIACQWLAYNGGEGHEGDACRAVAAWLKEQSDQRFLRACARESKVPVGKVRKFLADREAQRKVMS